MLNFARGEESRMTITLNHTIVFVRDKKATSKFLTDLFGLPPAKPFGPFLAVQVGGVTLDYDEVDDPAMGHYAFLVSEAEFDEIFGRIRERKLPYWADLWQTE
jgi:catechol 2,3-dioxygenase-like lactoylglutathione lyase family enzyme